MKKLFSVLFVMLFSLSINAQIGIPERSVGLGTHINVSVYYTGKLEGFQIEAISSFNLENFELSSVLYQNNWNYSWDIKNSMLKTAAVGDVVRPEKEEIAKIGMYINQIPSNWNNLSIGFFDGKSSLFGAYRFIVINIPYEKYGNLDKKNGLDINDAILMKNLLGTIPENDTLRITADLNGDGGLTSSEDLYLLLNKIVNPNAYWPLFDFNNGPYGSVGSVLPTTPLTVNWQKLSNGLYGLFSNTQITNGDLIGKPSDLSQLHGNNWSKKIDNKFYFINQSKTTRDPIIVANYPIQLSGKVNQGRKIIISSTVTDVEEIATIPTGFKLEQNYPNPFNPTTTISYQLPDAGFVTLKVYDILGKEVATLISEEKSAGSYSINFDASKLSSGMYLYKISSGNFSQMKKMILMK